MAEKCSLDITPYAQSEKITRPNIFNLSYVNQEFWSLKSRLIEYIQQNFGKDFSDFVESSLAIMLIETQAFVADSLHFKIDYIANEIYIDSVTELENAFRLSKLTGFKPQPPIPSRSLWTASINNPILTNLTIPTPLDVDIRSGDRSITIELFPADSENNPIYDQDIIIPAGNIVNSSVVGLEGKTRTQEFDGTGSANETLSLSFNSVIWDSIRVDVDGIRWDQVEYFTDSQKRKEYRVEFDSNYNAYVIFGNNVSGLIPSKGSKITVIYRTGGGTIGNIVSGAVETQTIVNVPGFEYSIPVFFRNYTRGEFGYNGDTIEDIRQKLPFWNRAQLRAVTGEDYKIIADQFATPYDGQIGKATAVLRNYGCAANIIDLYVLARAGDNSLETASDGLKARLLEFLEEHKMFSDFVCIKDGLIINTDVSIDVTLDKFYRKFEDEFRERITRKVNKFFALNNWDYGENLRDNDLQKDLADIREIKRYDMNFVTLDADNSGNIITAKFNEIIRPDNIEINFNYE